MAGVQDCYTQSCGKTRTKGNFLFATYYALRNTYSYLTPEFWGQPNFENILLLKADENDEEQLSEGDSFDENEDNDDDDDF